MFLVEEGFEFCDAGVFEKVREDGGDDASVFEGLADTAGGVGVVFEDSPGTLRCANEIAAGDHEPFAAGGCDIASGLVEGRAGMNEVRRDEAVFEKTPGAVEICENCLEKQEALGEAFGDG